MSRMTDDLENWAVRAAQELRDLVDEAEAAGNELPGTVALIEELDEILGRSE